MAWCASYLYVNWPYSYDSCDIGTLPNQTYPEMSTPLAAIQNGDPSDNNVLVCCLPCLYDSFVMTKSFLPGQRLCMFIGFDHL